MTPPIRSILALVVVALSGGLAACSPQLDWREFVPEGSGIRVSFPCRPDRQVRTATLAASPVRMTMLVCTAGDATYAISFFDLTDPARVASTLADWRAAALSNIGGTSPQPTPLQIKGMTPNQQTGRMRVSGRLPDGSAVQEHAGFFVHGLRVYQAAVIGAAPPVSAVDAFFDGLAFPG